MTLADNPVLGHITTFGGHPVSCAAGLAAFNTLTTEKMYETVPEKSQLFLSLLQHERIVIIRSFGLFMAVEFDSFETNKQVIDAMIAKGVLTDWFLFASNCFRICPPLTITHQEIEQVGAIVIDVLNTIKS